MLVPAMFLAGVVLVPACNGGSGDQAQTQTPAQAENQTQAQAETQTQTTPAADAQAAGPLMNPRSPEMNQTAPDVFKARFQTSKGDFVIEAHRDWAPMGVDRFYNLVKNGFYDDVRFFRVLKGFMAQFGINGDPRISSVWRAAQIEDDPVKQQNTPGMVSYAMAGPGTRTTQLFINYNDNSGPLDPQGFAPIGQVVEGMEVVQNLYGDYGEGAPRGQGPDQGRIQSQGNEYLKAEFPNLDYIIKATIVE
jgi:peptidyl-prolyl cis-trans isomerase A (cyclophilin A)